MNLNALLNKIVENVLMSNGEMVWEVTENNGLANMISGYSYLILFDRGELLITFTDCIQSPDAIISGSQALILSKSDKFELFKGKIKAINMHASTTEWLSTRNTIASRPERKCCTLRWAGELWNICDVTSRSSRTCLGNEMFLLIKNLIIFLLILIWCEWRIGDEGTTVTEANSAHAKMNCKRRSLAPLAEQHSALNENKNSSSICPIVAAKRHGRILWIAPIAKQTSQDESNWLS